MALVIGDAMLVIARLGGGVQILGETMIVSGIFGTIIVGIGALRRERDRR
ncbi:hypothetical protein [Geobacter grbiciae]|nr:hypothetical protein [Geobacter grbiciae]MBT1075838.1 hypothetical protein [Geobacter grbiciae]